MKPNEIFGVLDLAKKARSKGLTFNPMFVGDAGLGKSHISQAWVKKQQETNPNFGFIDLRFAYLEAQDVVGMPTTESGRTTFCLPEFWPTSGEGLLLLEEPNRAHPQTMQALMQLTTDRKVHNYKLPDGWIIAAAINPENTSYNVETMDSALKNRFQIFEINYDQKQFLEFAEKSNFHPNVINFVKSGIWTFKSATEIGENGQYISPRTWKAMSDAENAGLSEEFKFLQFDSAVSILGKAVGKEYFAFCNDDMPILLKDFEENKKKAISRLKKISKPETYRADLISLTITSLSEAFAQGKIEDELIAEVAGIIPADLSVTLIKEVISKHPDKNYSLDSFLKKYPELKKSIEERMKGQK